MVFQLCSSMRRLRVPSDAGLACLICRQALLLAHHTRLPPQSEQTLMSEAARVGDRTATTHASPLTQRRQQNQNLPDCQSLSGMLFQHPFGAFPERWGCTYVLQGNAIGSTRGLEGLQSLAELDLRFNLLASYHEVVRLSGLLPCLPSALPRQASG